MSLLALNMIALDTQITGKLSILKYEYYYLKVRTAKVDKKNSINLKINYKLKALESGKIKPIKIKVFNSIAFVITIFSVLNIGFGISNHLILNNKWYIFSLT